MSQVQSWFPGIKIETNVPGVTPLDKHIFFNNTQKDLIRISQTTLGSELLGLIEKRHKGIGTQGSGSERIVIIKLRPHTIKEGASTMAVQAGDRTNVVKQFGGRDIRFAGKGSKTYIAMHNGLASTAIYSQLAGVHTPTWIALAHELIHAWHHLGGNTYKDSVQTEHGAAKREEMLTTGLGAYKGTRISENAIRREVGLDEREYYSFPDDHTHVASLLQAVDAGLPRGYWYCSALQEQAN